MAQKSFKYIVVGGGLAGNAAVEGIRSKDKDASVLLVGKERHLPYDRPPLTKKLWFGKKKVEEIFSHNSKWFDDNHIEVMLETTVRKINRENKTIILNNGIDCDYEKLLLVAGGTPRKLQIEGGDMGEIFYYRYLTDESSAYYKNFQSWNIYLSSIYGFEAAVNHGLCFSLRARLGLGAGSTFNYFPFSKILQSPLPRTGMRKLQSLKPNRKHAAALS